MSKAWLCNDYAGNVGALVIFADTRTQARMKFASETDQDDFLCVRALRCPEFDGKTDADVTDHWWLAHGFWVFCNGPFCDAEMGADDDERRPPKEFDAAGRAYCSHLCHERRNWRVAQRRPARLLGHLGRAA